MIFDLKEMGYEVVDWIDLESRQTSGSCWVCGNEPSGYVKCGEFLDY